MFFSFSCEKWPGLQQKADAVFSLLPGRTKSEAGTDGADTAETTAPTLHLSQTDEELLQIAQNSQDTLPVFFRHLFRPAKGESGFRVKYPFRTDSGSGFSMEQLWLSDIRFKDGVYYGILVNTPFYIASIKKGDTVSFSAGEITDWMFIQNGKIIGGLSIKYLLEQIPNHERSEEQHRVLRMFE
ncbi:hypothetical protein AGMMS50293_21510 [Spirochaetia bacterium]|nr:hypothetical protein AGMMS50293_21510 [Spirochaetia bacterium]